MIMKTISKLLSVLIVYGVANNANAQKRDAGEWSIIPKVGVKLAKLKGDKIGIGDADNNFLDFSSKLGYLIRRNIVMSFVLCTFVCIANAVPKGEAAKVRSIIDKVNNSWQSRNNPEATPFWHVAAYHTGNIEAYRLTGNKKYLDGMGGAQQVEGRNKQRPQQVEIQLRRDTGACALRRLANLFSDISRPL